MPSSNDPPEKEFRIKGDPDLRITESEVEAAKEAQDRIRRRLHRDGKLRDADPEELRKEAREVVTRQQTRAGQAHSVRHGMGGPSGLRMPTDEEIDEIERQDPSTGYLFRLGRVQPGTAEFMAKAPPPEPVIDVIGPKGPEGFGVIKRMVGTGPDAGLKEIDAGLESSG